MEQRSFERIPFKPNDLKVLNNIIFYDCLKNLVIFYDTQKTLQSEAKYIQLI